MVDSFMKFYSYIRIYGIYYTHGVIFFTFEEGFVLTPPLGDGALTSCAHTVNSWRKLSCVRAPYSLPVLLFALIYQQTVL